MIKDFFLPLVTVGLSELGDKTQFAVLSLSSKQRNKLFIFAAVMLAFIIVDGLAVLLGTFITKIVPLSIISIVAGVVFVAYGCYTLIMNDKEEASKASKATFLSIVGLIILLEMGDKSQIATVLFASEFNPLLVFIGVELALALLTIMAILIGNQLQKYVSRDILKYASGIIFILVGFFSLVG